MYWQYIIINRKEYYNFPSACVITSHDSIVVLHQSRNNNQHGESLFLQFYHRLSDTMDLTWIILSILIFFLLMLTVLHIYVHKSRKGYFCDQIPGPTGYPIIGNVLDLVVSPGELIF